jgi:hypothetical protein
MLNATGRRQLVGSARVITLQGYRRLRWFVDLIVVPRSESAEDGERRARRREERLKLLRRWEDEDAGPAPFRVTLAQARAQWPGWVAAYDKRRARERRAIVEAAGPVLANFLIDVHWPELPSPTEVVAYAVDLECEHEAFQLAKRSDPATSALERGRCPIASSCQLGAGRTAVRYLEPGDPEPEFAGLGLTRWSVDLACGHTGEIRRLKGEERVGDYLVCPPCGGDDPDFDVKIVAFGERLADRMVQNWAVELDCGHRGTDHFVPVEARADPAAYRTKHPRRGGLRCLEVACDERQVRGVRRLGVLGKIRVPSSPSPPRPDRVTSAAQELRLRLTK